MAETTTSATEINTAPLLTPQGTHDSLFGEGARTSTTLSILLGIFAGRRGASMIVRESAARQLHDWRDNWGHSLPVVAIDTTWNLAFVVVSVVMLFCTAREKPNVPVRAWICVYALQCAVHMVLVWLDYVYTRRNRRATTAGSSSSDDQSSFGDSRGSDETSAAKRWEAFNTIIQYLWWLAAFCWLIPNYDLHSAPRLFWLTLTFMAIDMFFVAIGFLKELIIGLAVCFCFPCTLAFLYIMGGQGGASEAEIRGLPKYSFVVCNDEAQPDVGGKMVPFETNGPDFSREHVLLLEDSDCCICLCSYENGAELHLLPCNHPFHATCIVKWLKISRTCPLCKCFIGLGVQV
ncbi:hypothetical protein L2E82_13706 [Cichorium intybus]|uniref:Uncharacterized protein n=1 Tax=Cichorium intybus TaxID=13427 RepID=A0ACB9EXX9_CICIN|nr:hypothetical protein L2E82_13706 [Cichorium intybus]